MTSAAVEGPGANALLHCCTARVCVQGGIATCNAPKGHRVKAMMVR